MCSALFARGVEHSATAPRKRSGCLQEKRALSDTRITTNERNTAGHNPTTKNSVELSNAGRCARNIVRFHFSDGLRAAAATSGGGIGGKLKRAMGWSGSGIRCFGETLQSIPCATIRALAHPFRLDIAALTTDEAGFDLCH